MTAFTTKPDILDITSVQRARIYKSFTITSGDTLATGLKDVWAVSTVEPAALTSWSVANGVITFTTTQVIGPGPLVVWGR